MRCKVQRTVSAEPIHLLAPVGLSLMRRETCLALGRQHILQNLHRPMLSGTTSSILPEMTSQAGRPIRTDFLITIGKSAWSDDFAIPS